jgi:hypothetical protein
VAILIFMEGVLRNEKAFPIADGMALYRILKERNRVLVMCEDKEKSDHWLRQHRINNIDDLVDIADVPAPGDFPKLRQVEWVKSQGPVEYVITSDPDLTVKLLEKGITTLVFLNPTYAKEEFRPDSRKGVRSWSDITTELERQQDQYQEDERVL